MVQSPSLMAPTVVLAIALAATTVYSGKIDISSCGRTIKFNPEALKYIKESDITLTCSRSRSRAIPAEVPAELNLSPRSRAEADAASAFDEKLSRMQLDETFAELNLTRSGAVRDDLALPATERVPLGCGAYLPGFAVTNNRVFLFLSPPGFPACLYIAAGPPGQPCAYLCDGFGTTRVCGFACGPVSLVLQGPTSLGCKISSLQTFPFSFTDVCRA